MRSILAAATTSVHLSMSATSLAFSASGLQGAGSLPNVLSRLIVSGSATARRSRGSIAQRCPRESRQVPRPIATTSRHSQESGFQDGRHIGQREARDHRESREISQASLADMEKRHREAVPERKEVCAGRPARVFPPEIR
jgi:hypothetical protein